MSTNTPPNQDNQNNKKSIASLEQAYTYEEPDGEDTPQPQQQEQQQQQKPTPARETITQQWAHVMNSVNIHNMQKLVNLDEFVIEGKTYTPRRLKPREILELNKIQDQLTLLPDWNEKKFGLIKKHAAICLNGWSDDDFDNIDIVFLEQVLGACMLRTKGFRKL